MPLKKAQIRSTLSPLRYPGAKRWMVGYIARAILCNKLPIDLFVEPFAGGSSVSISLLLNGCVNKIGINERDPLIASFWYTLFFDTDWLIDRIKKTEVTLSKWNELKHSSPVTCRQKAFKCFYLNRTSFSGILKSNAGPIGGKKQLSKYKIDCRFNKVNIISRIEKISLLRDKVAFVWNLDWEIALNSIVDYQGKEILSKQALFYLDPPFFNKSKALYTYCFSNRQHHNLRDYLGLFKQPWILSYDMCPEILNLYSGSEYSSCDVNLIYTSSNNGKRELGKELIVTNFANKVSELRLGIDKHSSTPKIMNARVIDFDDHFTTNQPPNKESAVSLKLGN